MRFVLVALRLHRWTLGAVAILAIGLAVLCGWLAWDIGPGIAVCERERSMPGCAELASSGTYRSQDVVKAIGLLGFLPFIAGSLLGAPLVAREIELRTASVAWPLSVSRLRWLLRIAAPVIGTGAVLVALPAVAGFVLVATYAPSMDPWRTFEHFGLYGPALVVRYLAMAAIGVLAGIWLGRTLPGLIVSAAAAGTLFFVLNSTTGLWLPPSELPPVDTPVAGLGRLFVRQMVRMPDGRVIPFEEALAIDPELDGRLESIEFGLPPDRALDVALRENAALLVGTLLCAGASVGVLRRRRPY